jgi:hypothetical protein
LQKKDVSIPLTERKPEISPKASEEVDSSEPTKNLPQKQTLEPHNSASGKRNVESKLVTSVITELENEDQQEDVSFFSFDQFTIIINYFFSTKTYVKLVRPNIVTEINNLLLRNQIQRMMISRKL